MIRMDLNFFFFFENYIALDSFIYMFYNINKSIIIIIIIKRVNKTIP